MGTGLSKLNIPLVRSTFLDPWSTQTRIIEQSVVVGLLPKGDVLELRS